MQLAGMLTSRDRAADVGTGSATVSGRTFVPLSSDGDWQPQDFHDSRGITEARAQGGRLIAVADLKGADPERSQGEIYTNLRYYVGLEGHPLALINHTLEIKVEVPCGFVGESERPTGSRYS